MRVDGPLTRFAEARSMPNRTCVELGQAIRPMVEGCEPPWLNVGCGQKEKWWPWPWVNADGPWRAGDVAVNLEEPLPFADDSFGGFAVRHVFEHVFRLWELAAELLRVARPGAVMAVSAPLERPSGLRRLEPLPFNSRDTSRHARRVNEETWRGSLFEYWDLIGVDERQDVRWHSTYAVFRAPGVTI
jgi:SAM-dependent methyltransferase